MSELTVSPEDVPVEGAPVASAPAGPAITAEELTPALRKHVDPKTPVPLRAMGAKLLVPASPHDALCMLYLLSFDADPSVRDTATKTAGALPDKIAVPSLRDDGVPDVVLGWVTEQLSAAGNEKLLEVVVLNPSVPDDAIVAIVPRAAPKTIEMIGQNQLRLLRSEALLRTILLDSQATPATKDSIADFAIRSGLYFPDVPALVDARRRIHGDEPPAEEVETADSLLNEFKEELADDRPEGSEEELPEGKKLTLVQRVARMTVAEKIKLANRGNKEARTLLLRDSNKLVAVATVGSPRISQGEVLALTNSRTVMEDVLRVILRNRDWMKIYTVKWNLVRNPKTPLPTAMKLVNYLRVGELRDLSKDRNVSGIIQNAAKNQLAKLAPK